MLKKYLFILIMAFASTALASEDSNFVDVTRSASTDGKAVSYTGTSDGRGYFCTKTVNQGIDYIDCHYFDPKSGQFSLTRIDNFDKMERAFKAKPKEVESKKLNK